MKNETLGLEKMEIGDLIREIRKEMKISQDVLYHGLCKKKVYFQLENGDVIMDELLSECLFSRLHVQYHLVDILLDHQEFEQKELRYEIDLQIRKKCRSEAEQLLAEYEAKAPKTKIHRLYVMSRRAEICYQTGTEKSGRMFLEALELTMPPEELENRLRFSGVIAAEELWLYFRYRSCEKPFSPEEYAMFLERVEGWFLRAQIHVPVYFEAAYQYALEMWRAERYVLCREVCKKAIAWIKRGRKELHLAEFYFLDAIAGMQLRRSNEEEIELCGQCKMAYYISESFGEREVAEKIATYCKEEFGWHITV